MLPQLIKTIKEKKAEEISVWMLIVLLAGVSGWVYYGFAKNDVPIIITNCFSLLLNTVMIYLRIHYKR